MNGPEDDESMGYHSENDSYIRPDGMMHVDTADGADAIHLINCSDTSFVGVLSSHPDAKPRRNTASGANTPPEQAFAAQSTRPLQHETLNDLFFQQTADWKELLRNGGRTPLQMEDQEMWKQDLRLRQVIKHISRELQGKEGPATILHYD